MSSVYFDPEVGGSGLTVSDDNNPATSLAIFGWKTRLVPAFSNVVAVATFLKTKATAAAGSAAEALGYRNAAAASADSASASATAAAASAGAAAASAAVFLASAPKTASFSALAGVRYRVDNSADGILATLPPAPAVDGWVGFTMLGGDKQWSIDPGTNPIGGESGVLVVDRYHGAFALRFVGGIKGWVLE